MSVFFFFFNDTATTEIYTLSLHDALPISDGGAAPARGVACRRAREHGDVPHRVLRRGRPESGTDHVRQRRACACLLRIDADGQGGSARCPPPAARPPPPRRRTCPAFRCAP